MSKLIAPTNLSDSLKLCLEIINDKRDLFDYIASQRFVHINEMNSVHFPEAFPTYIFLKFKEPIRTVPIITDGKEVSISFGHLYTLYSSGIAFGYLFEFPKVNLEIRENSLLVENVDYNYDNLKNVEMILRNTTFSVYKNVGCLLVVLSSYNSYIKFKNSKKQKEEKEE